MVIVRFVFMFIAISFRILLPHIVYLYENIKMWKQNVQPLLKVILSVAGKREKMCRLLKLITVAENKCKNSNALSLIV